MSKFRSKADYAQIYSGDKQGFNLGIDGAIFLKTENTPRVFQAPSIGTQGSSISAVSADTDISGGTDTSFKIAVDGGAVVDVVLVLTGLTTGVAIAAALESKINAALLAAGQDARVWASFNAGGPDQYTIYSQSTGTTSSVVVTPALSNNVADDLLLGLANSGVEAAGTNDTDFLLYTTGGPTFSQPIESNAHRSGRYHSGIVKQKKVVEWGITTYVNMSGTAGDSIDSAVRLLWKNLLGTETVSSGSAIRYRQGLPNFYFSMVRVSTIFAEYFSGLYTKEMTLTFPGDGPATCEWSGMGAKRLIAGIAKTNGAVAASANVILDSGLTERYDVGAPVMAVDDDGRTIVAGQDGSLTISSITAVSHTLGLSAAITLDDNSYIVPWNPGAVQQTGRDSIYTDLEGSFKLQSARPGICATNIVLSFNNDHVDRDNCFGSDGNDGFIAGNRLTASLSVTFDLNSEENFAEVVQSSKFLGFAPEIILGSGSGRRLKITAPKWLPAVPALEVPDSGSTPITMEGDLYQSVPGAADPFLIEFL